MAISTRYTEIRSMMVLHGMRGPDLGEKLGLSGQTVSAKLCGKSPWTVDEMYYIMDLFKIPYKELHKYFPKNGISNPRSYRKLKTDQFPTMQELMGTTEIRALPQLKAVAE